MDYITKTTEYPPFTPCPNSLFEADLSATAKLTYLVLLNRALLSRSNDWIDEQGRVFIVYPIEELCKTMKLGSTRIKQLLVELSRAGHIRRVHQGINRPDHIYVLIEQTKKCPSGQTQKCPSDRHKSVHRTDTKASRNYNKHNYNKENYTTHTIPDLSDLLMKGDDR